MSLPKLFVIAGPSGVGKGTVRSYIMNDPSLNLAFSISLTTRKPRPSETDGIDYFFVTRDRFLDAINNHELIEYTEFANNFYGTSKLEIDKLRKKGKNVILEIEINGTYNILKAFKRDEVVTFFIAPPSFKELEKRIRGRSTETEDSIKRRLARAKEELKLQSTFDYVIVNDDPIRAANEIKKIIKEQNA